MPMKNKNKSKLLKPRVIIPFNTGTRVMRSKRDKMRSRQNLNKLTKEID
jgi:hypothetical protein